MMGHEDWTTKVSITHPMQIDLNLLECYNYMAVGGYRIGDLAVCGEIVVSPEDIWLKMGV